MDVWRHVTKSEGCWLWTGSRRPDGYGVTRYAGKPIRAHRLIYELEVGPIPPGLHLLHKCDNPPCVRPDHLWPGTQTENLADMTAKGRRRNGTRDQHGELNAIARLTDQDVLNARARYVMGEDIKVMAASLGVHPGTLRYAVRGRTWAHLPMPSDTRPPSNYRAKLTAADCAAIRKRLAQGHTRAAISRDYGVSSPAISALALGKTHR